jgi:transposase
MSRMAKPGGRRARRKFSEEFRDGAVRLVLDEGRTAGSVARELDLTESALRAWVARAQADRTKGKSGLTTAEREELARLPYKGCRACSWSGILLGTRWRAHRLRAVQFHRLLLREWYVVDRDPRQPRSATAYLQRA